MSPSIMPYFANNDKWVFRWFEFSFEHVINIPMYFPYHMSESRNEKKMSYECFELLQKDSIWSKAGASATFFKLFAFWMSLLNFNENINPHSTIINEIILMARNNLSKNMSINEMATISGLSNRRFQDVFVKNTGCTPKKYIKAMKLNCAKDFLKNTSMSIDLISEKLGYSSQFHFSNSFKKFTNFSPSEFRNK